MKSLAFTWDDQKNQLNIKKHKISFEEAQTVFFDENAIEFEDPDHSAKENRFILLGLSYKIRTLVVCHCFRNTEKEIRIISARKATKNEQKIYNRGLK